MRASCSEDLILVWPEESLATKESLRFDLAIGLVGLNCRGEDTVEGLVHNGWAADPNTPYVLHTELSNFLSNELFVPALWVDFFL
mmetsp:Transcript_6602/g.8968  ORF Transcript_6602/g.8968 Transcript_6602/m.8968 type:complete len:85 (-) Transcript_6602:3510-3764(-)